MAFDWLIRSEVRHDPTPAGRPALAIHPVFSSRTRDCDPSHYYRSLEGEFRCKYFLNTKWAIGGLLFRVHTGSHDFLPANRQ